MIEVCGVFPFLRVNLATRGIAVVSFHTNHGDRFLDVCRLPLKPSPAIKHQGRKTRLIDLNSFKMIEHLLSPCCLSNAGLRI